MKVHTHQAVPAQGIAGIYFSTVARGWTQGIQILSHKIQQRPIPLLQQLSDSAVQLHCEGERGQLLHP